MVNLRSGVLFSEERESIATRESEVRNLALLYFRALPKKERLIAGYGVVENLCKLPR